MEQIILHRDNGSLPDPYYYGFELIYYKDASAHLKIYKGRGDDNQVLKERNKKVDSHQLEVLRNRIKSYTSNHKLAVGGGQRIIILQQDNQRKAVEIHPDESEGMTLYEDCFSLFDPELEKEFKQVSERF